MDIGIVVGMGEEEEGWPGDGSTTLLLGLSACSSTVGREALTIKTRYKVFQRPIPISFRNTTFKNIFTTLIGTKTL